MNRFYLLQLKGLPIFEQLRIEEALLRCDTRNWCIINEGSPDAIVVGISGKPELLINQDFLKRQPVPVIRRFSGGGTVFVDSSTYFVTWICNSHDVEVPCYPEKIGGWTEQFYRQAFPTLEMSLRENDYVIGDRKFGGNAQYLRKDRWLHHTSLLWDYDQTKMNYLLFPHRTPRYREKRDHHQFLCRLNEYISKSDLELNIIETLHKKFEVRKKSLDCVMKLMELSHRKTTSYI